MISFDVDLHSKLILFEVFSDFLNLIFNFLIIFMKFFRFLGTIRRLRQ